MRDPRSHAITLRLNTVNLTWDGVTGSTSYDILLDGTKVAQAGPKARTTKIAVPAGAERLVQIKAQPSGQIQGARFEWSSVSPPPPPPPITWQGQKVITAGGTYTGNWETTTSSPSYGSVASAVIINTSEPVTLLNCQLRNMVQGNQSPLIFCNGTLDLTLEGCTFYGPQSPACRVLDVDRWTGFTMRNCTIEQTSGFSFSYPLNPDGSGCSRFLVTRNKWHNNQKLVASVDDTHGQALQLRSAQVPAGSELSWNQVINEPGLSWQEDVFSLITVANLKVHDNYIQHQSTPPGTLLSSQGPITTEQGCRDLEIYGNHMVDTPCGIGMYSGINCIAHDNRLISDGYSADLGVRLQAVPQNPGAGSGAGMYISTDSQNCHMHANVSGFVNSRGDKFDWALDGAPEGAAAEGAKNTTLPSPITRQMELDEWARWQAKLAAAGITVGA